jgi:hypothetical protein
MKARFLVLACVCVPVVLAAQTERGGFLVRLGTDTIAIETYDRTAGTMNGRFASRAGQFTEWSYLTRFRPNGTVATFEMTMVRSAAPDAPAQKRTIVFDGDSAFVTLVRGDSTRRMRLAAPRGTNPFVNHSFALYQIVARQARAAGARDTFKTAVLSAGADAPWATTAAKLGADSLVVATENGLGVRLKTDRQGKVIGANGHGSTQQVDVERQDVLNFQALADAFAARPAMGQLSVRDTARATIGDSAVWVDYGRPLKRGRDIFGVLVPWNVVWRTGANAATQLSTPVDLTIGDATVPAGIYTVWTLPSPTGWKLIINKQHAQWGTEYRADSDFVRIDLKVEPLPQPTEQFTIAFDPQADGSAVWRLEWDRTRLTVPVAKK